MMKPFLFYAALLTIILSRLSTTRAGSATPMAKEFTSDIVERKNLAYDFFGPTDFLQMDAHRLPDGQIHNAPDSPESKLVGGPIQDNPDKVKRANPITYVDRSAPPFLIVHGTLDRLVPFNQSQLLAAALEPAGAPVKFHPVEGGGHGEYFGAGGGCGLYADPEVEPLVTAFFATYLAAK
jgi:acetyl esterase/lipase